MLPPQLINVTLTMEKMTFSMRWGWNDRAQDGRLP
jgi:hypothetical protein